MTKMTKYCSKCRSTKEKALFYKHRNKKDELQGYCKTCMNVAVAAHKLANKDIIKTGKAAYRLANPDKCNADTAKRKALKLHQTPSWYESEREAIAKLYAKAIEISKGGIRYHVDHIVPLNSKLVSGFHCLSNLQILPAIENISKGNRFWEDMWI